jgi:hypothetical protein
MGWGGETKRDSRRELSDERVQKKSGAKKMKV